MKIKLKDFFIINITLCGCGGNARFNKNLAARGFEMGKDGVTNKLARSKSCPNFATQLECSNSQSGCSRSQSCPNLNEDIPEVDDFEKILKQHLDFFYTPSAEEITKICDYVIEKLKKDPTLLKLSGPIIIAGDIHGDIGATEFIIRKFLEQRKIDPSTKLLCLGDYIDRGDNAPGGPNSLKILSLLFQLKIQFPNNVFLLRGNHEGNYKPDFDACLANECARYEEEVFQKIISTFDYLSLAAVVENGDKKMFCIHGGIAPREENSPEPMKLEQITNIQKPIIVTSDAKSTEKQTDEDPTRQFIANLLWSDPKSLMLNVFLEEFHDKKTVYDAKKVTFTKRFLGMFPASPRRIGKFFDDEVVSAFLKENGLTGIFRGHSHRNVFDKPLVITICSSEKMMKTGKGSIAYFSATGEIGGWSVRYSKDVMEMDKFFQKDKENGQKGDVFDSLIKLVSPPLKDVLEQLKNGDYSNIHTQDKNKMTVLSSLASLREFRMLHFILNEGCEKKVDWTQHQVAGKRFWKWFDDSYSLHFSQFKGYLFQVLNEEKLESFWRAVGFHFPSDTNSSFAEEQ